MAVSAAASETADSVQELLNWNNLTYTMPITNSVVSARNVKTYPADQASYQCGTPWIIYVQTGSQYVDWTKSFLQFKIKGTLKNYNVRGHSKAHCALTTGVGSICNFIDSIIVTTRSGAEVHRIEKFNAWRILQDYMKEDDQWFKTEGHLMGYSEHIGERDNIGNYFHRFDGAADDYAVGTDAGDENAIVYKEHTIPEVNFIIPMYKLGGLFESKQLCPAVLASGLRIEIRTVQNPANAITVKNFEDFVEFKDVSQVHYAMWKDATLDMEFTDLKLNCDTYLLNDSAMRELNQTSAQYGLEYVYNSHFHQTLSANAQTNMVCSKAVSRALSAMAIVMKPPTADLRNDDFDWSAPVFDSSIYGAPTIATINSSGRVSAYATNTSAHGYWHNNIPFATTGYDSSGATLTYATGNYRTDDTPQSAVQVGGTLDQYQWRLGSQYFPHTASQGAKNHYWQMLYSCRHLGSKSRTLYKDQRFYKDRFPLIVATFERSNTLRYSGVPINNSRTLALQAVYTHGIGHWDATEKTYINDTGVDLPSGSQMHMWLEYLTLAKAFLNNVVVSV